MVELILIIISFIIIIYIIVTSKNNKNKSTFDDVLNENYKLDKEILVLEVKKRDFIDKILDEFIEYEKKDIFTVIEDKNKQDIKNEKMTIFKNLIEDGYNEIEICQKLNIGRGEFLLLKNLYKK